MGDTDVTVEVEPDAENPPADTGDTVVVVTDDGGGSGNDLEIGVTLGALVSQVSTLTETLNAVVARLDQTESTASAAIDIALDASLEAGEAVAEAESVLAEAEEAAEDAVEELIEPNREHWLWKRRGGLREAD